jgi:hypothetical protein
MTAVKHSFTPRFRITLYMQNMMLIVECSLKEHQSLLWINQRYFLISLTRGPCCSACRHESLSSATTRAFHDGVSLALDLVEHYNTARSAALEHEKTECRSGDHDKRPEKTRRPPDLTQ